MGRGARARAQKTEGREGQTSLFPHNT